ncbi:MAG: hypothetical protein ACRDTH_05545, partial [Pseudonocardiaceae bacterium]
MSTPISPTPSPRHIDPVDPCEVASVRFDLRRFPPPTKALISRQRVLGAGSLLQSHRYGDLLRVFDAV